MRRAWLSLAVLVVGCAPLLVGCGGDDTGGDSTAQDAARDYVQARNQGDAGRVCELYSDQLIQQLHATNCEAFVKEQTSGVATTVTLVGVRQTGDHATATLRVAPAGVVSEGGGQLRITLRRQDGEGRITDLGGAGVAD
jgi:ketosteroid isomerase-like protein